MVFHVSSLLSLLLSSYYCLRKIIFPRDILLVILYVNRFVFFSLKLYSLFFSCRVLSRWSMRFRRNVHTESSGNGSIRHSILKYDKTYIKVRLCFSSYLDHKFKFQYAYLIVCKSIHDNLISLKWNIYSAFSPVSDLNVCPLLSPFIYHWNNGKWIKMCLTGKKK